MGFLTQVVLHIDALHAFRADPKAFGEAILDGIDKAEESGKQESVGFKNYGGYIGVEPMRHADHNALFISSGNCMHVIGDFEKDWQDLLKNNPEFAEKIVKQAGQILKQAKKSLKENK